MRSTSVVTRLVISAMLASAVMSSDVLASSAHANVNNDVSPILSADMSMNSSLLMNSTIDPQLAMGAIRDGSGNFNSSALDSGAGGASSDRWLALMAGTMLIVLQLRRKQKASSDSHVIDIDRATRFNTQLTREARVKREVQSRPRMKPAMDTSLLPQSEAG